MLNLVKTKNKGFLKILKRVKNINWFYVIVLTFLVAYVSHLILKYHFVLWDEAVYIGIGKYLFSSGQVGLWEEIRPLGIPLLFGGAWKLGLNPVIAGRVIELLFSIGTISLVYLISKEIFNKKIASINIVIYVITPLFFYNSLRLMTGVPSTFFVLLATYFFIKKQLFWAGLGAALAFIFRYPQGLIVLICLLTLLLEFLLSKEQFKQPKQLKIRIKRLIKDFTYFLSGFLPLIIVLFIFNYYKYGSALYPFISAFSHGGNLVHAVESKITGLFFYLIALLQHNLLLCLGVLGFVIAIWQIIRKKPINKTYNKLIIIVLSIILFYSYLTIIVNKQARFGIVIIPFLAILSGYGLNQVLELIFSQTNKKTANHNITIKQTWLKILPIALLIIFIIYSFGSSMYMNYQKYNSFPAEKPVIVDEIGRAHV